MAPHVVVDVRMAADSGIGTYIRNTVPRIAQLQPDWRFTLLGRPRHERGWAAGNNLRFVACDAPIYGLREQWELVRRTPRDADLFWSPQYNVPLATRATLVATIHDMGHLRLPEHARSVLRQGYARFMFAAVRRKARAVICPSRFTMDEYRTLLGAAAASRATVVYSGVDRSWFAIPAGDRPLARPYFLFLGNLKPHKNVALILEAMRVAGPALDAALVIVGRREGMRTVDGTLAARMLGDASLAERVIFAGELPDAEVRQFVTHAAALVFPSRYEGFGLPPLEAMAAGTPAIVSRAASLPEVCGDAALYVDPHDASALADAMQRVLRDHDLRASLAGRGRAHARRFDWEETARRTRDVLARAMEQGDAR